MIATDVMPGPTLRMGDSGADVAKLQQALRVYQGMDESEVMQDVN